MDDMLFMTFLCYYAHEQQRKNALAEDARRRRRYRRFRSNLSAEGQHRRDRRIPRASLSMPWDSPWQMIFGSANDQSLITLTGFDCESFNLLHGLFLPLFNRLTPHSRQQNGCVAVLQRQIGGELVGRGRKRIITSEACLALLLVYNRTTVPNFMLSVLFGVTGTAVTVYIRFARSIVIHLLSNHPLAQITLPTNEKVAEYKQAIAAKYPLLENVYCVCDGLRISIQAAGQPHVQRRYYNGWQKEHCIANIFVFAPDGTIIAAVLNCPGCMHDSQVAELGFVYAKLEEVYERVPGGAKCVMDSAFSSVGKPYVLKSIQAQHRAENAQQYMMYEEATSMRQAAEWGMHGMQSSFGRLKGTLRYETEGQRSLILLSIVFLHNWRANTVGLNQIQTVFMPHLTKNVDRYIFGNEYGNNEEE